MIVLVANLGSTSFKYKLFDIDRAGTTETVLAQGDADRISQGRSTWSVTAGEYTRNGEVDLEDHGEAIDLHLHELVQSKAITAMTDVEAIGFKAVHGGPISKPIQVDDQVLEVMTQFAEVAPQHNPPYIDAMRAFMDRLPGIPQVAAFETAFHQTIPMARQVYGIPAAWIEDHGMRRYGFHGASHCYIATRMAQIAPEAKRVISCHLGGSCSICAIQDRQSVANSFGMTAQTGVLHASRVGDFDAFAILQLLKSGFDLDTIWQQLGKEGGLKGLSGVSADMREVEQAAHAGNERAKLAVDAFVESVKHYIGAYLAILNGVDALVFTGGIGENGRDIRTAICKNLDFAGIEIDPDKNMTTPTGTGNQESQIHSGKVAVWIIPTNEELIVARQTVQVLSKQAA